MDDVFVRIMALPCGVNAVTVTDANCDYNVYINSSLRYYERRAAYRHEMAHIESGHFVQSEIELSLIENR